jgi:hypothetical protein
MLLNVTDTPLCSLSKIARNLREVRESLSDIARQECEVGNLDQIPNDVSAMVQVALLLARV